MRPVLEKRAILFQKLRQMFAPIGLVARKQDLMMGALDGCDAVHLHEADVMDELQQPRLCQGAVGRIGKPLFGKKHAAGITIRKQIRHKRIIGINSHAFKEALI